FMDSAWFKSDISEASKQQEWFIAIGNGKSLRELDLPIGFTRRMAQCFLAAPHDYSIEAALRWGQIIGVGGTARLVRSILGSRIGRGFEDNDFWLTVILWLIQNPMFNPAQIAPLVDFIYHKKF